MHARLLAALVATLFSLACSDAKPRSVLLFVMDTTRADAVSAYDRADFPTTPNFDALAREGLLYMRAYAPAPWTLPSHASLFTGLLPGSHGVGWRNTRMPEAATTLAEQFAAAGYATFGHSENVWVGPAFALAQGFERFVQTSALPGRSGPSVEAQLARFLAERDPEQPFFAFVNVIDAHWPYGQGPSLRFLPEGVTEEGARAVSQLPSDRQCQPHPDPAETGVIRALYEGDVADADAKLGRVLDALREAGVFEDTIVVVTADHGEMLGEKGLFGHQYSLHEDLLRVPLVVRGRPQTRPARIERTVSLVDVMPSLLAWTGLPAPESTDGESLPVAGGTGEPGTRTVFAEYADPEDAAASDDSRLARGMRAQARLGRAGCAVEGWPRLYGDLRAAIAPPFKRIEYARMPPEIFLVDGPEGERPAAAGDEAATSRSEALAKVMDERFGPPATRRAGEARGSDGEVSPDVIEALESLGYVAGEELPGGARADDRDPPAIDAQRGAGIP